MLFYRYISENLVAYINRGERAAGHADFDFSSLDDEAAEFRRASTVTEKGFYILPSELFANPPYSIRWKCDSNPLLINDPRFSTCQRAGTEV